MSNYERDDELTHYGVPGMKWGVRKSRYYSQKSDKAKKAAGAYDARSKHAKSIGDATGASKYAKKASKSRSLVDKYKRLSKRFDPDTPMGQLEMYKHNERVKKTVSSVLGAGALAATAVAMYPAIAVGAEFSKAIFKLADRG